MKAILFSVLSLLGIAAAAPEIQLECPCPAHPKTAIITAAVNPACPDKAGESIATVADYTELPGDGKPPRTYRQLKSVSPCGCITKGEVCPCIPIGIYRGVCKDRLSTYEIPCDDTTLACSGSSCPVAPPSAASVAQVVSPKSTGDISPLQQAQASLVANLAAYSATSGSLTIVQGQLVLLQSQTASLSASAQAYSAAAANDMITIKSLLSPGPQPGPGPGPAQHVLSVVMVEGELNAKGEQSCAPCKIMDPIVDKLNAAGQPVTRTSVDKWAVKATPCFVVLVDGKEVQRSIGGMTEQQLVTWIADIQAWIPKAFPVKEDSK